MKIVQKLFCFQEEAQVKEVEYVEMAYLARKNKKVKSAWRADEADPKMFLLVKPTVQFS